MATPSTTPPGALHMTHVPETLNIRELEGIGRVAEMPAALHLQALEVELVLRTSSGAEYSIPLDKLTPAQKRRLSALLVDNQVRNIHDEMNPARGQPSPEALELAELARIALGHPISFQKGQQLFIRGGSFLRNYEVDDRFRDRVLSKPDPTTKTARTPEQKIRIHNQYNCGKRLLAFTRNRLAEQKAALQAQLDGTPADQLQIKSTLKHRIERLEKTIEFYDSSNPNTPSSIQENTILTAALYPLDLTGLNDTQIKTALDEQKQRIKEDLDEQAVHGSVPFGSDLWNRSNPNYEPRSEREGLSSLLPFGASSTSIYDSSRQSLASDIAEAALERTNGPHNPYSHYGSGKNATPESLFIELQQLAATDASDRAIDRAIRGPDSYFSRAFPALHEADRQVMAESIYAETVQLRNAATAASTLPVDPNTAAFRQAFDAEFTHRYNPPATT
jgi:hypothetical protein